MKAQNEAVELVQVPQERLAGMEPQMRDLGKGRPLLGVFFIFASIAGLACGLGQAGLPDAKVDPYKKAPIHHAPVRPNHAGKKRKEVLADGHLGTKGENGGLKMEDGGEKGTFNAQHSTPNVQPVEQSENKPGRIETTEILLRFGRFQCREDCSEVWFDGGYYDLRNRHTARYCILYFVLQRAFEKESARHLITEIDPYVRTHCDYPQPSEIKIHHYFNDRNGPLAELRNKYIQPVGKNGKYFLLVD